jgi:putative ABC transport system substrate-binding protein
MRRIALAVLLAFCAGLASVVADAQQPGKLIRIGVLTPQSRAASTPVWDSFRAGLRELGWEEGKNIVLESRYADGQFDRLPALAEELVKLNVSVIVAANSPGTRAAMSATKTTPIVMVEVGDPVATGFVASLARPGANVTGLSNMSRDLTQKRLELLKEAVPRASRIAVLLNPDDPITLPQWRDAEAAAGRLGVQLLRFEVRNADDLERAFAAAVAAKADAVLRLVDPLVVVLGAKTLDLLARYRLPAIMFARDEVVIGALMSYFADRRDYHRRAAIYVDRILKGAKTADLPIEQPIKFELAINLKTAKALGLTIPQSLLLRADQVIE